LLLLLFRRDSGIDEDDGDDVGAAVGVNFPDALALNDGCSIFGI
jgi:hypothetical protein